MICNIDSRLAISQRNGGSATESAATVVLGSAKAAGGWKEGALQRMLSSRFRHNLSLAPAFFSAISPGPRYHSSRRTVDCRNDKVIRQSGLDQLYHETFSIDC